MQRLSDVTHFLSCHFMTWVSQFVKNCHDCRHHHRNGRWNRFTYNFFVFLLVRSSLLITLNDCQMVTLLWENSALLQQCYKDYEISITYFLTEWQGHFKWAVLDTWKCFFFVYNVHYTRPQTLNFGQSSELSEFYGCLSYLPIFVYILYRSICPPPPWMTKSRQYFLMAFFQNTLWMHHLRHWILCAFMGSSFNCTCVDCYLVIIVVMGRLEG